MRAFLLIARVVLAVIFLYSGIIKAGASEQFAMALAPFTILPSQWTGMFAVVLPWTELAAGVMILVPRLQRAGAALMILLTLTFIAALSWALATGLIVDCGCFGTDEAPSAWKMVAALARDFAIFFLAAATLLPWGRNAPA